MAQLTYQMLFILQWIDTIPQVIETHPPLKTSPRLGAPLCRTQLQSILLAYLQLQPHYTKLLWL